MNRGYCATSQHRVINSARIGAEMRQLRHFPLLILAVLLAGLFTSPVRGQELKFGYTPVLSEPEMRAEFEPLMDYLSESIGQKVTLYIAKDYGDLRTQMENGSV